MKHKALYTITAEYDPYGQGSGASALILADSRDLFWHDEVCKQGKDHNSHYFPIFQEEALLKPEVKEGLSISEFAEQFAEHDEAIQQMFTHDEAQAVEKLVKAHLNFKNVKLTAHPLPMDYMLTSFSYELLWSAYNKIVLLDLGVVGPDAKVEFYGVKMRCSVFAYVDKKEYEGYERALYSRGGE